MAKEITVLAFGVFDLFHEGHKWFLREAAKLGRLVIVVARDVNVEENKGSRSEWDEVKRLAAVEEFSAVAEARLGYEDFGKRLDVLDDIKPDVVVFGYDQEPKLPEGSWKIVQLEAYKPEKFKSSLLRKQTKFS